MPLKRNIPLMYIIACLMWARFYIPVLALFYIASQVSLEEFAIIMSAFMLSNFVLEIPTGIIGDLIGRKKTLIIGRSMFVVEVFILAFMNGFWPFLIAKIVSGVGVSFVSGSSEALLYDTLKKLRKEKEHKIISGTMFTLTNISMAFVFPIGAYLFSIDHKLPAIVSLPAIIVGVILTGILQEPYESRRKLTLKNSWLQFKEGLWCVGKNPLIKHLMFFSMAVFGILDISLAMSSAYFEKILIPITFIGVIAFATNMIIAFVGKNVHAVEGRLGDKRSMQLIELLLVVGLLSMSSLVPYYGVLFYVLIAIASGFFHVLANHYMNVHADTTHRATILSINHMMMQLGASLLYVLFGQITRWYHLGSAFFYLGLFLFVYSLILFGFSLKMKDGSFNEKK